MVEPIRELLHRVIFEPDVTEEDIAELRTKVAATIDEWCCGDSEDPEAEHKVAYHTSNLAFIDPN